MSNTIRSGLLVCALTLAGCARSENCSENSSPAPPPVGLAQGQMAPEIDGLDADGRRLRLSEYRGKVVVLDFWATW
jgi:AhpC/TSA family